MAVESIESLYIQAIRAALVAGGLTVYDNIANGHDGRRTKSSTFMQIARSWTRTMDEITEDCIQGEYTYLIRYHQSSAFVINTEGEALSFDDMCQQVEKAISQVKTAGQFTRPNMAIEETTTSSMRGLMRDWTLSGTVASRQDRGEVAGPPVNTSAPVISGLEFEGQTLSSTNGTWIGSAPITFDYDWKSNGTTLGAPNQSTYVVGSGLVGTAITCTVTGTNGLGNSSETSNSIVIDTAAAPSITTPPTIAPDPVTEGDTLTASGQVVTGNPTPVLSYQWKQDLGAGFVDVGTDQATYDTQVGDAGDDFKVELTATNLAGSDSADSNTVTADSGAVLWTPTELGSALEAWHDSTDATTITASGGDVSQWRDKSLNANHLDQASAPDQFETGSLTLGGLNVMDCSTAKFMEYDSVWTSGAVNVFQVVKLDSTDTAQGMYGTDTPGSIIPVAQSGSASTECVRIDNSAVTGSALTLYVSGDLEAITTRGELYTLMVNDAYRVSSIAGFSSSTVVACMGKTTSGAFTLNGSIAQSVIVSGTLATSDRQKLEGWASWLMDGGVAGTLVGLLPGGHPYKSAPPFV